MGWEGMGSVDTEGDKGMGVKGRGEGIPALS